jgi:hypothetical protein
LNGFSIDNKLGCFLRIGLDSHSKPRCGERGVECYTGALLFDLGQFLCGPNPPVDPKVEGSSPFGLKTSVFA